MAQNNAMASTTAATASTASKVFLRPNDAFFQLACMPGASRNTKGSMGIRNATEKYGGPTEILPRFSASRNTGYKVPSRMRPVAATSSTLFMSRKDSRDTGAKPTFDLNSGARHAYRPSAPPTHA